MKVWQIIFIAIAVAGAGACAEEQAPRSDSARFGSANTFGGMSPGTGLGGFRGSGSWGPANQPMRPNESSKIRGFKGL
jgi:hypothetical protein